MYRKKSIDMKKVYIMRHGNILVGGDNYENLSYEEFMPLFLKTKNPPLRNSYGIQSQIIYSYVNIK